MKTTFSYGQHASTFLFVIKHFESDIKSAIFM
jgi:hypothetical protein